MRYLFILNPAAGKQDCTVQLIPQLQQAAVRAGIPVDAVATCKTEYAGHAKALARAAAEEAARQGMEATKNYEAKFGRAKSLMQRSIGYQDAGATSVWIIFKAMHEYVSRQ